MRLPRPRSIRQRLLLISAAISLLTLTIAGTLFVVNHVQMLRAQMLRDLEVLSVVVGENCLSALVFDAPETAEKNLASLRRERQIRYAVLYGADGRPFASYRRDVGQPVQDPLGTADGVLPDRSLLGLGSVEVQQELSLDGRPIGRIFIYARTDELNAQLRQYVGVVALLLLVTLAASLLFALRLQRRVSDPILHLAAKTREISQLGDYGLRVSEPDSDDEIAGLFRGFNVMLAEIQRRDAALAAHAEALDRANAQLRGLAIEIGLVQERERKRLAAELHDSAMQKLAVAQIQIAAAADAAGQEGPVSVDERVLVGLDLIREALAELREIQFELSPPALYLGGVPRALESLAAHTSARLGVAIAFVQSGDVRDLPLDRAVVLYQCARELVYNLIKHAQASRGRIRLRSLGDTLELEVEDNGIGFRPDAPSLGVDAAGGYGLHSIRERLALLGGSLRIEFAAPGTRAIIRLPLVAPGETARSAIDSTGGSQ